MAGLLGALAAGAATGYGAAGAQNANMSAQFNLTAMQNEVKELMDERVYERTKGDKAAEYAQGRADKVSDYQQDRTAKKEDAGMLHRNRMEEIAASKDPQDAVKADAIKKENARKEQIVILNQQYASIQNTMKQGDPGTERILSSIKAKIAALGGSESTSKWSEKDVTDEYGETKHISSREGTGTPPVAKSASIASGLPAGAKQIGTSGGKPVYQTPDGKRFIGE